MWSVCVCVLVVGNPSVIDLLLYVITVSKIAVNEADNPWMARIAVGPEHLRLHDRKDKRKENWESS